MAKEDYIKTNADAFAGQLQQFKTAIPNYATILDVTAAQISAQADDADYFSYLVACQALMRGGAQQWTNWRDYARFGGTGPSTGEALLPLFPTKVKAVEPGIEERFREVVQEIKKQPNYNPGIGEALGIEGPEQTGPNMNTVQATIEAIIRGTEVLIKWGWGGYSQFLDMCEIQVDRGDGKGWVMLAFDTTPNYTDSTPFPATPTKWSYQAIYRVGDHRVGQWSNPVSVMVGAE